jgi:fructokinase
MPLYGGIEAGGTKFVCAVGSGPDDLGEQVRFPTTTPDETLGRVVDYFTEQQKDQKLAALGIASFGPVDPIPTSPTFGYVTSTPKAGWTQTDFVGPLRRALGLPVGFDTDVNGAALAEHRWGAAQGLDTFVYLTVGTGVGGGAMVNGKLVHGMLHPEMGHMRLPHDWEADPYEGSCPYHGDCLEGMVSGPAMQGRWQQSAQTLPADHPAWDLEAHYLALGLANIVTVLSPQRFIMGGGVMDQAQLFPMIQEKLQEILNGYVATDEILNDTGNYVVPPKLGARAGVLGAIALAQDSLERNGQL